MKDSNGGGGCGATLDISSWWFGCDLLFLFSIK
jgi:hypothetical protein